VHGWLNPQLVTTPQAPASHESFARAGDEYKLPVAETIPDATTDPSQIRVTPVVDPTAKKTTDGAANPNSGAEPDGTTASGTDTKPSDPFQTTTIQVQEQTPPGSSSGNPTIPPTQPAAGPTSVAAASPPSPILASSGTGSSASAPMGSALSSGHLASGQPPSGQSLPQVLPTKSAHPTAVSATANAGIPSSLRTQLASSTPDSSGNKAPETAMDSIEPVVVTEATARGLATDQPMPPYPSTAKNRQGTVVLQVLIGRDGTVQDAKFLQGSLAFAHSAIDGVRQWKFKPYIMNGRPVSVQTQVTISFKPGS
jgi:TonB family protein